MHRLLVAAVAAASIAAAASFAASPAQAMPLPGTAGVGAAAQNDLVQDVRHVCRPVWNGWRWVEQCYWVPSRPHFHHHHHHRHHMHRHHHHRHHHHHRRHRHHHH